MKNILKLTGMVLLTAFVLASCSKEKRIERRLASRSGKWNIVKEDSQSYVNGVLEYSSSDANTGYITFDKDGSLVYTITDNGATESYAGTWSNTEDNLSLVVDGESAVFEIEEDDRKSMSLKMETTSTFNGDTYKDVYTMELEKDK